MAELVRIGQDPHTWDALTASWRSETEALEEIFDDVEQLQADILKPLVERNENKAAVFALFENGRYRSICQLNTTGLPGYDAPVMRMRHLTFAPSIDLSGDSLEPYIDALLQTFWQVLQLCRADGPMSATFMNFHLPSPNDRHFFTIAGNSFMNHKLFKSIVSKGAWLYITMDNGGSE
jgi:hypothetical protein